MFSPLVEARDGLLSLPKLFQAIGGVKLTGWPAYPITILDRTF